MLNFPAAIKVYLCTLPCDMRRLFDDLSILAEHLVRCNPLSEHLFVYCNCRTDRGQRTGSTSYTRRIRRAQVRRVSRGAHASMWRAERSGARL